MAEGSIKERFNNGILGMSFLNSKGEKEGQCLNCKWYNGEQKCDGFTGGIPDAVFDDAITHDVPVDGDGGFVFSPKTFGD